MIYLVGLIVLALIVLCIVWVVSTLRERLDGNRKRAVDYRKSLNNIERHVREIANTSDDPTVRLQASALLDEIANSYEREI